MESSESKFDDERLSIEIQGLTTTFETLSLSGISDEKIFGQSNRNLDSICYASGDITEIENVMLE